MQLMLAVGGSANQEQLQSLRDWLLADRAVRQYANAELGESQPAVAGRQGPAFDVVSLAISSGFSASSLGVAIASWRASRPDQPAVTIERSNGAKITFSGSLTEEDQQLLLALLDVQD